MTQAQVAVVVGVGPGLGAAAARRFAKAGYRVALMARGEDKLEPVAAEIRGAGGTALSLPCDATDPAAVNAAFERVSLECGSPSLVVYNAGAFKLGGVLEISPEEFERCFRVNCAGGLYVAQAALPSMLEQGRGTLIFTGATASLRGGARFACLAVGKFGLRALAQSLAREFGPRGIHAAHVIIDGQIDLPRTRDQYPERGTETFLSPDAIAETYYDLHLQGPTAWTHEIDLRPAVERF